MKRFLLPLLAALALTTAVNAETSNINAGFIDFADVPAPDISEEESEVTQKLHPKIQKTKTYDDVINETLLLAKSCTY